MSKKYHIKRLWLQSNKGKSYFDADIVNSSDLNKHEIIIKSLFSLVSSGTEKTILTHKISGKTAERMRVPYMLGHFNSEFTYGYSLVGKVVEGDSELDGRIVHVMHPHQDVAVVDKNSVYPIPGSISPESAILASNLETIVNAIWDSRLEIGDRVLVVGFGLIGSLLALVISHFPGVEVMVCEKEPTRQKLISKFGLTGISNDSMAEKEFDVLFNTSGTEEGLQLAIDHAAVEGRIIEISWFGPKKISLNLGEEFHYGRKKIISSQVSHIPANKQVRFDTRTRKDLVFNLLHKIDFSPLISRIVDFKRAPEFYEDLVSGKIKDIGILFKYN